MGMSSFGSIHYWRVGDLGCLHNASGVVSFNSLHPSSNPEFQPSSLPTTRLSPLSSLLRSINSPFPILLFALPTPLPPANAHTSSKATCPPSAAPMSYTIVKSGPRAQPYGYGGMQKGVSTESSIPVQLPAFSLSSIPLFKNKVEDEIEGRSGGIDQGVGDG